MSVPVLSRPLITKRNPHTRKCMSTAKAAHRDILADSETDQRMLPHISQSQLPQRYRSFCPLPVWLGPQSQSFFRRYGSVLPTSLTYIVQRLKALHLGDLLRIWVRSDRKIYHSPGFSRDDKSAPDTAKSAVLYGSHYPISLQ